MINEAIEKFMDNWQKNVIAFYIDLKNKYNAEHDHHARMAFYQIYGKSIMTNIAFLNGNPLAWFEDKVKKDAEARKAVLINKVEAKGGKIIDATNLYIGVDGNINGYIKCENKNVTVTSIYAGGYNIQCLHYRLIIK